MTEPVLLPVEIWCQIFSYLDKTSIRSVSATCTLFFGIVRGEEKFSGHVILKQIDLGQLLMKIKSSEWTRERWPCLKTLEIPIQLKYPKNNSELHSEFDTIFDKLDPIKRALLMNKVHKKTKTSIFLYKNLIYLFK